MPKLPPQLNNDYWRFILAARMAQQGQARYNIKTSVAVMLMRYDWS